MGGLEFGGLHFNLASLYFSKFSFFQEHGKQDVIVICLIPQGPVLSSLSPVLLQYWDSENLLLFISSFPFTPFLQQGVFSFGLGQKWLPFESLSLKVRSHPLTCLQVPQITRGYHSKNSLQMNQKMQPVSSSQQLHKSSYWQGACSQRAWRQEQYSRLVQGSFCHFCCHCTCGHS